MREDKPPIQTPRRTPVFSKRLGVALALLLFSVRAPGNPPETGGFQTPDLTSCRQLVLVIAPDRSATGARLRCFERDGANDPWRETLAPSPVTIGRNGLAWGIGLHGNAPPGDERIKREGDGRAPAGAFGLTTVFGYVPAAEARIERMPYQSLTASVEGVDDPSSRYYNRIVDSAGLADKDWKSSETMRREDGLYRWGVVVGHNSKPSPGAGSCIFLHIWRGSDMPTSGCTAMPADFIEGLARWLDRKKQPVLVQLPADEYARLKAGWRLP